MNVVYQIQWQVPAEASFDKRPYWTAAVLGDDRQGTEDEAEARELLASARQNEPGSKWRLVRVTSEVIDGEQS